MVAVALDRFQEIAAKLGIAISTVEKHVALGLKRCRGALAKDGIEFGGESSGLEISMARNKESIG